MATIQNPAIPKDSIVVITGANGLLGSNIVDKFLEVDYRVRGTVRNLEKCKWLQTLCDEKYGPGRFELFAVPDFIAEGALKEVMAGASALIHTASPGIETLKSRDDIAAIVDGAETILRAAYAEPSIKRIVYTSSTGAVVVSHRDRPSIVIGQDTYDEDARLKVYGQGPPGTPEAHIGEIYCVSKQMAEKAVWKFYDEHKAERPDIVLNTTVPNMNFGSPLDPANQRFPSSTGLIAALFNNQVPPPLYMFHPQQFIDTKDNGYLHVAAAINPTASGERIFGMAGSYSWDDILAIMRSQNPGREFPADFSGGVDQNVITVRDRGEELLKSVKGSGWATLEAAIAANTAPLKGMA